MRVIFMLWTSVFSVFDVRFDRCVFVFRCVAVLGFDVYVVVIYELFFHVFALFCVVVCGLLFVLPSVLFAC